MNVKERVKTFQNLLRQHQLDAYIVPSADPHQSEYVADTWKRREFISGFYGSAGLFALTQDLASLWTDSRYYIQAEIELKGSGIKLFRQGEPGVVDWIDWLILEFPQGGRIGLNFSLFSISQMKEIQKRFHGKPFQLIDQEVDLLDQVWGEARPSLPKTQLREHPIRYAGETAATKLARLRSAMTEVGAKSVVVSALDEIAWLFNLRGADVTYNPVFYAFALISESEAKLYVDHSKISPTLKDQLKTDVSLESYEAFQSDLVNPIKYQPIWLDPHTTSAATQLQLERGKNATLIQATPLPSWKAIKNQAELSGMRQAHVRDGVAMVRFLAWLDQEIKKTSITEIQAGEKLHQFRCESAEYIGPSFATIAGYGPNGALPHYRAKPESCATLEKDGIFLVDSGGQYIDGTTDITRTVTLGQPSDRHKEVYTSVLKGHLLLVRSLFPRGTNGYQLDVLARQPIWKNRLNYKHGTGHGVGAALCVHEGPFSVSLYRNLVPLEVGHILSNEPGCYLEGEFGVRIENLVTVIDQGSSTLGDFLGFEDLTLCPYDQRLIDRQSLSSEEIDQINRYHQRVYQTLSPLLTGNDLDFLQQACQKI